MENAPWIVIGSFVGLGLGAGLFGVRRAAWGVAMAMGWGSLLLIGGGILFGIGTVATSMSRGGEAVIAGMTFAGLASVGLVGTTILALGMAAVQGRAIGRPTPKTLLTALADPVLLGLLAWMFLACVIAPLHKASSDASWKAELARRDRLAELERSIPEPYRQMPIGMIDQHNEMRRQMGGQAPPLPPLVPPETERKLRELAGLKNQPDRSFDFERYRRIEADKRLGLTGLGIGWLVGAFLVPLGFLAERRPLSHP